MGGGATDTPDINRFLDGRRRFRERTTREETRQHNRKTRVCGSRTARTHLLLLADGEVERVEGLHHEALELGGDVVRDGRRHQPREEPGGWFSIGIVAGGGWLVGRSAHGLH